MQIAFARQIIDIFHDDTVPIEKDRRPPGIICAENLAPKTGFVDKRHPT